jgi:glycosyltransferase involved in cell wall biosynthesis
MKKLKTIMVDSLIGNDYSTCLCESIFEQGVEVHMIVPQNRDFPKKVNFDVVFLSPSKEKNIGKIHKIWGFIKYIFLLRRYIKVLKCDLVHYQFFRRKVEILFFKYLKLIGVKLIVTAHNVLPHEKSKMDYFLKSIVYKNADAIIVHSNYIKNKLLESFAIDPVKVHIIPHGNFDIYLPKNELTLDDARSSLSLSVSDNVILFFGFIRPYKGIDLLLQAFEISAEKDSNLKLIIAGSVQDKDLESSINSIINNSKFKDRIIHHLQYIPNEEIVKYFSASDLVILPYKNIDHSGIIHLAYSFGKAVLSTNVGDFSEVIINDKSGKILKGASVNELSKTLIQMFQDKYKLQEMGEYAKSLSKTKYSWTDISKQTIQLYSEVSSKK